MRDAVVARGWERRVGSGEVAEEIRTTLPV